MWVTKYTSWVYDVGNKVYVVGPRCVYTPWVHHIYRGYTLWVTSHTSWVYVLDTQTPSWVYDVGNDVYVVDIYCRVIDYVNKVISQCTIQYSITRQNHVQKILRPPQSHCLHQVYEQPLCGDVLDQQVLRVRGTHPCFLHTRRTVSRSCW